MADKNIDWADEDSDAPVNNSWADDASEDEKEAAPPPRNPWGVPQPSAAKPVADEEEFPTLGAAPTRGSRQPSRGGRSGPGAGDRRGGDFRESRGDRDEGARGGDRYEREDRGYPGRGGDRYDREDRGYPSRGGDRYERPRRDDRDDYGRGDRYEREGRGGYDRDREGGGYDRPPRADREPPVIPEEGPWTAFVGNLNFKVEAPELEEFFIAAGCKLPREGAVRMTRDRETDRPRGIAYVDFEDAESLRIAISLNGEEFAGRNIRLDVAENKRRDERRGGQRQERGDRFGADRYDSSGDASNWRELAKKAAEERAAASPVERDRERRDDRPDRPDRPDRREYGRPAPRPREPAPAPTEEEEREREEKKKALEEKRAKAGFNPFGDAKPRDELAAQRKLQELEEKMKKKHEEDKKQKETEEEEKKKQQQKQKEADEERKKKEAELQKKKPAAADKSPADDKWRRDASSPSAAGAATKGAKPAAGGRGGFDWKDRGAWNADKGAKRPEAGGRGRGERKEAGGRGGEGPRRAAGDSSTNAWGRGGRGEGARDSRPAPRKETPAPAAAPAKAAPAKAKQPAKDEKAQKESTQANAFDLLGEAEA